MTITEALRQYRERVELFLQESHNDPQLRELAAELSDTNQELARLGEY